MIKMSRTDLQIHIYIYILIGYHSTVINLLGHITSQCCHLVFHGGDLVSLINFEGTILYQAVSCVSVKNL